MAQTFGPGRLSLAEWVTVLEEAQHGLHSAALQIAEVIGHHATEKAKDKLGNYQGSSGPFPSWPTLSPATIADKLSQGFPTPSPLLRTGEMQAGIGYEIENKGPGDVVVTLHCDAPYADYQEFGTIKMPPRPFAGPAMYETIEEMAPLLAEAITEVFYPHGFLAKGRLRK